MGVGVEANRIDSVLRMVLMPKALSVSIEKVCSFLFVCSASVMAAISARFIVCRSDCDFVSICVVVWVLGLTMDAPRMGLHVMREPSV